MALDNNVDDDFHNFDEKKDASAALIISEKKLLIGKEKTIQYRIKELKEKRDKKNLTRRFCKPNTFIDKFILAIYCICILVAITMGVLYFIVNGILEQFLVVLGIITTTWIGVITGIITIYNGNTVIAQADNLDKQNKEYSYNIDDLIQKTNTISNEIRTVDKQYYSLVHKEKDLKQELSKFSGLVEQLRDLQKDWPQLNQCFSQFENVNATLIKLDRHNDAVELFHWFYEAEFNNKPGLSKEEFDEFYEKIPQNYRTLMDKSKLNEFDKWDLDNDGNISKYEFQKVVNQLLDNEIK